VRGEGSGLGSGWGRVRVRTHATCGVAQFSLSAEGVALA